MKIGIAASKRIVAEKKKGADKSGVGIKIIGIAHSSSTIGSKISSYQMSETALSVMAIIGMINQIADIRSMIDDLTERLEEGCQFTIGWGAGSVCMTGLLNMLVILQETKRSLRRWQMPEFPMSLYFVGMLILIGWNQGRLAINQCGGHNFLNGAQKD